MHRLLGAGTRSVGIDDNTVNRDIILPTISKQKNLGSAEEPDMEALIALKPDLIVNNQYFDEGLMKKLQESGLTPLAMIYHGDIQNSLGYSKMLGYLTGSPSTAEEYVNWMGGTLGSIHDKVAGLSEDEKTKVIFRYPRKNGRSWNWWQDCRPNQDTTVAGRRYG